MKESVRLMIEKAQRAIQAAETLLNSGDFPDFAIGRAYYAMFYVAEALLEEKGLRFSKHGGVHGAFGEHFVKTGFFDQKYHRWLLDAFDKRIEGDYSLGIIAGHDDARVVIIQAQEFMNAAIQYFENIDRQQEKTTP
jgi:uncharacterized protein (UPF0332 family)